MVAFSFSHKMSKLDLCLLNAILFGSSWSYLSWTIQWIWESCNWSKICFKSHKTVFAFTKNLLRKGFFWGGGKYLFFVHTCPWMKINSKRKEVSGDLQGFRRCSVDILDLVIQSEDAKQLPDLVIQSEDTKQLPDLVIQSEDTKQLPDLVIQSEGAKQLPDLVIQSEDAKQLPLYPLHPLYPSQCPTQVAVGWKPVEKYQQPKVKMFEHGVKYRISLMTIHPTSLKNLCMYFFHSTLLSSCRQTTNKKRHYNHVTWKPEMQNWQSKCWLTMAKWLNSIFEWQHAKCRFYSDVQWRLTMVFASLSLCSNILAKSY